MKKSQNLSRKAKLAELINENPKLLRLLPRFNIALGFGDHSVEDVCRMSHVNVNLFLMVCGVYTDPSTTPHGIDYDNADIDSLLAYLNASHRFYLEEKFPHIEEHLGRIIKAGGPKYGNMLKHFYDEYQKEMSSHFRYEEEVVLPYIDALRKGQKPTAYDINQFRHNHSNIEDALEDMNNILIKYLPGDILPKERIEIATDIMELSADLISHSLIEEHILIPYVESLENALT